MYTTRVRVYAGTMNNINQKALLALVSAAVVAGGAFLFYGKTTGEYYQTAEDFASLPEPASPKPVSEIELAGKVAVEMTTDGFIPEVLNVKRGTTVVWVNKDKDPRWPASDLHPTHTIYPEFDPQQPIMPGEIWEMTFANVGTWKFHDHLKPYYTGNVEVVQ